MPAPVDLARTNPETGAAVRAYRALWNAIALTAIPADRPAAEAAVAELYERARLPRPRFAWVASPAAAAVAAELIGYPYYDAPRVPSHRRAAIAPDRLGPQQAWSAEVRRWMGDEAADDPRWPHPRRPMAALLGFDALRSSLTVVVGSGTLADLPQPPAAPDLGSGATAIGDAEWAGLTAALPGALVEELLRRIGREVCADVRDAAGPRSKWLASVPPWMMGQFDPLGPYLAAAHELFGRRITSEFRDHLAPYLALAKSSGPWVALEGLAVLSERATSRRDVDAGRFRLSYRDGLDISGLPGGLA